MLDDHRTMYETAKQLRVHLQQHLEVVVEYLDDTRVLYDRLQRLGKQLHARYQAALESEEQLGRQEVSALHKGKGEAA